MSQVETQRAETVSDVRPAGPPVGAARVPASETAPEKPRKKPRWLLRAGFGIAGVLVLLRVLKWRILPATGAAQSDTASANGTGERKEPEPVAVTTAPVTQRSITRTVQIVGTFHGQEEVLLTPKVEGRVLRLHHDIGDLLRPGELLLEIEDTDYR